MENATQQQSVGVCRVVGFDSKECGATAYEHDQVRGVPACPRHELGRGSKPKPEFTFEASSFPGAAGVMVWVYSGWTDGRRTEAGVLSLPAAEWELLRVALRAGQDTKATAHGPVITFKDADR